MISNLKGLSAELKLNVQDLESQTEEYRLMLSNANFVIDEKESSINEYEEKIRALEDKLEKTGKLLF